MFVGYINELLEIYGISGPEYFLPMIILLLSNLVLTGSLIGGVYQAFNYPEFISLFVGVGSIINFGFSIFLIPSYGILGACVAIFVGNFISQFGLNLFAYKKMKFKIDISKFLISFSFVLISGIILIFLSNHTEMFLVKTLYTLFTIIAYLISVKVIGFFNKKELAQLVFISKKSNSKILQLLIGYFLPNKDI